MLPASTITSSPAAPANASGSASKPPQSPAALSPLKLARLDVGLFHSLVALGTARERICAVLNLSTEEYEYVSRLA